MSFIQNTTSGNEKKTATNYIGSLIPLFNIKQHNDTTYSLSIVLVPCPDSSIKNVGFLLTIHANSQNLTLNFDYFPSNTELKAYISNTDLINKCEKKNDQFSDIYSCLLELSFFYLDQNEIYGSQAGSSILFWLTLQRIESFSEGSGSIEIYISALKDQFNCNCSIIHNVPLSLTLCSTELC